MAQFWGHAGWTAHDTQGMRPSRAEEQCCWESLQWLGRDGCGVRGVQRAREMRSSRELSLGCHRASERDRRGRESQQGQGHRGDFRAYGHRGEEQGPESCWGRGRVQLPRPV